MKKQELVGLMMAMAGMMSEGLSSSHPSAQDYLDYDSKPGRKKTQLDNKQSKARAKSKRAKKARRKNRKR